MAFYRCGNCSLNLPPRKEYRKCPQCETPTAIMKPKANSAEILSEEEAARLAAYAEFERRYGDGQETPLEIATRQARYEQEQARAAEQSKIILEKFEEIIAGGGWRDYDRKAVQEVEEAFDLYLGHDDETRRINE
jgi:hypothetical protein